MRLRIWVCLGALLAGLLLALVPLRAQVNTGDLSGQVVDPKGLAVAGASVTVKNLATSAARTTTADASGNYSFVGLTPGQYSLTVEAKGFAKLVNPELALTIGQKATFNASLQLAATQQTVTVTGAPELIETTKTAVTNTIDTRQIENLPINQRDYINFTLLTSQAKRDDAPSIGAAPTSGINFSGQRARSNDVTVDGADAVDNAVNGIRSTVSQEAVQEFQIIQSGYMPEFGRAMGGVINIVTKSGSNAIHGDVFGYLRHSSFQARNPFSVQVNPATGEFEGVKQAFTRVQAGATIGGPIQQDKTFYFFSFETRRRQETGFTNIGTNNFGLVSSAIPCFPSSLLLTSGQAAFYTAAINQATGGNPANCGNAAPLLQAAAVTGDSSAVALFGNAPGGPTTFPLPIDCNPQVSGSCTAANIVPLPASFVPLTSLVGNYPVKEKTDLWSARLDHIWNDRNTSFVRVSVTPSFVTGIQVNAQNQNFGQNAASRTSLQRFLDDTVVAQHTTTFGNFLNEARFQFARRGLHYGFSNLPGGSQVAVNIIGFAFFGREPFSTVDRIERRWEWSDDMTWVHGRHTLKWGADTNLVQLRSNSNQVFELNYGGLYDFGALSPTDTGLPTDLTAVQAYGLGIPQAFIQGLGTSARLFDNKALGVFLQDSWRPTSRLTLNYGVRYDIEWTPTFKPGTPLNAAAEPKLGVLEGIPVDSNNVQPRFGIAWDPTGSGKTVIRADYGIFFDHPLLAVAFDSTTADGALSSQLVSGGGIPTACSLTTPVCSNGQPGFAGLNASSIFQGVLNPGAAAPIFGYEPNQQRFNSFLPNSILVDQNYITQGFPTAILPFTLPTARNFVYAYAQQAGLTVEREFAHDYTISLSYNYTHGLHLNRPRNINVANPDLLTQNYAKAIEAGLAPSSPLSVALGGSPASCSLPPGLVPPGTVFVNTAGGGSLAVLPGSVVGLGFSAPNCASLPVGFIGVPAVFNFFRPSGPNPSFAGPNAANYAGLVALAQAAGFPTGSGVPVPWSDVDQQESSGNSVYHGFTLSVSKRFSHHIQFLSSWTWSHAIDDSTDLQTLLVPQDSRFPNRERASSTFDQRHRWVTSAIFESPYKTSDSGWWRKFLANFTWSPIFELSSGRPYTVLTGTDVNLDFSSTTDRPSVVPVGTPGSVRSPFVPNVAFVPATVCDAGIPVSATAPNGQVVPVRPDGCTGNLGRNAFVRPGYADLDMQLSRRFFFTERANLEVIADAFNVFNRFNVGDVNPLCDPTNASACLPGQPSAALDPRQFQFALKVNW
jgi:Carboxypeptidase regulatory-like domain/TonB dependent receptor-like, beta-barrel